MTDQNSALSLDREPPVLGMHLHHGKLNLLDRAVVGKMREGLAQAIADPEIRCVLLKGTQRAFCAGLDMKVLSVGGEEAEGLLLEMGEFLHECYRSPIPIISQCEGHAVAAGAMLLLVSDLRVGRPGKYRIGFSEVSSGMALPELPIELARDRLNRRYLLESTALGRLWSPEEAMDAGFLDEVVSEENLEHRVREQALELAEIAAVAYQETIRTLRSTTLQKMDLQLGERRKRLASPS